MRAPRGVMVIIVVMACEASLRRLQHDKLFPDEWTSRVGGFLDTALGKPPTDPRPAVGPTQAGVT